MLSCCISTNANVQSIYVTKESINLSLLRLILPTARIGFRTSVSGCNVEIDIYSDGIGSWRKRTYLNVLTLITRDS